MSRTPKVFVPHIECTVASGDCFSEGRCLGNCVKRQEASCQQQIRALLERVAQLEVRVFGLEGRK